MRSDTVAIVPAGGMGRRLGALATAGKPALVAGDRTFFDRVCTTLAAEVPRVIVVAAPGSVLPAASPAVEIVRDSSPGAGPLAALRDGLAHACAAAAPPRFAVLCSCDVPLVVPGLIRLLLDLAAAGDARWVLPVVGGREQPLVSALAVDALPVIKGLLAADRSSFRDLAAALDATGPTAIRRLDERDLRAVDPALDSFLDVDTPEDLARVVAREAARLRDA